ncbi:phosphoenolpyruvate carboxykinase (ATP) [Halobacteriovorax sp. GB3]|uniref:phosphoenolpyruvate carboxykinase (ATP) n=1 Tax=Halobacteriovorax sp. GB3 TaxID=2719615 RepID=UPI0023626A20|nr:phosphoenolpyruvate carboxykinase (ATP) [Halobacteriovorax sp. GB3]MDD0854163.1 phosphoenolpyruvate carboxykinase (ATP) [Halobacteriovorax sp. GB3]
MFEYYKNLGINTNREPNKIHLNSAPAFLIQETVRKGIGRLTKDGSLVVLTGKHTGRSANDRYIVKDESTLDTVWWENNFLPMTPEMFQKLKEKVIAYHNEARDLYITERSVGADETHNLGARLVTTNPNHALFSNHLFRDKMREFNDSDYTILHAPELTLDAKEFETRSETCVVTDIKSKTTIIVGTLYAGEIKKSMFAAMNYELPTRGILPMHSGASRLENMETSVFFGLSGTGKTTLSTDEGTYLIGDDEHGLSDAGIFNFEGGCYAKTYKLSKETEPEIFEASNKFGAMLENVVMNDETATVDFFDKSIAENGRSSYPLNFIDELEESSRGKLPSHIFFLSADAFGVLPPVARLTKEQAMFYFVLGYTAKLAGTEIGVKEPQATFSPCFGAPFMLRHPSEYARLLGDYLDRHDIKVWMINTGWTGGAYGTGQRFPLHITRQIIRSIQANTLNDTPVEQDPIFGLNIPAEVKDVPQTLLAPQKTWPNTNDYTAKAEELALSFHEQMKKFGDFYDVNIEGAPLHGRK